TTRRRPSWRAPRKRLVSTLVTDDPFLRRRTDAARSGMDRCPPVRRSCPAPRVLKRASLPREARTAFRRAAGQPRRWHAHPLAVPQRGLSTPRRAGRRFRRATRLVLHALVRAWRPISWG